MNDDHTFAPEMTAEEAIQMVLKRPEMYGLQKVSAVPDAATELRSLPENGCDKQAHDTMNRNINRVVENNMSLVNELEAMKAERDAALATVERVRAVGTEQAEVRKFNRKIPFESAHLFKKEPGIEAVFAALDGAPEPEEKP